MHCKFPEQGTQFTVMLLVPEYLGNMIISKNPSCFPNRSRYHPCCLMAPADIRPNRGGKSTQATLLDILPEAGKVEAQGSHKSTFPALLYNGRAVLKIPLVTALLSTKQPEWRLPKKSGINQTAKGKCPKKQPGGQGRIEASTDECF